MPPRLHQRRVQRGLRPARGWRTRGGLLLAALAAVAAGAPLAAQTTDPLESLVRNSPFLPASGGGAAADSGPLEFRGVVFERGAFTFSVYDQGTKESSWVRLGEKGFPYLVRSYNRENDTIVVEQNGRTLTLTLQTAKVNNAPLVAALPQPATPPGTLVAGPLPGQPAGVGPAAPGASPMAGPVNSDEAQRLQKMADEIRRRRNLRSGTPTSSTP